MTRYRTYDDWKLASPDDEMDSDYCEKPMQEEAPEPSDRVCRYLDRVDGHLRKLPTDRRRPFITEQLDAWERRYAKWRRTEGKSEFVNPGDEPIDAVDFLLTIAELEARRVVLAKVQS